MQPKKNTSLQVSGRKNVSSRMGTQQNQVPPSQSNPNINANKQKQDAIVNIVKQYLDKSGYPRTAQTFKNEKPSKRLTNSANSSKPSTNSVQAEHDQKSILTFFEKGNRQQFFKHIFKLFSIAYLNLQSFQNAQALRKLQFQLHVYFCVYNLHPFIPGYNKKNQTLEKAAVQPFKKFIQTKGAQISQDGQLLGFFALPYIQKPQQNPSLVKIFTKDWLTRLRNNLTEAIRQSNSRNTTASNKQNKKNFYPTFLHELYDKFNETSVSESRIKQEGSQEIADQKLIQKYQRQNEQLSLHNKQMVSYLDMMQNNLKELNEASKNNILESNRKWFQFAKQIIQINKRALNGENVRQQLDKYQRFFGTNIDELIYCTQDISIFQKNSYTEDHSMFPITRNVTNMDRNSNNQIVQMAPVDFNKIMQLFSKAHRPELENQICLVLKALKQRLNYHKSAYMRREVVVSYQRNDICAIKDSNYEIQKKLLLESPERVKQFYLRLMNYIATDDLGDQYISNSQKLIRNLIQIMGTITEDVPYRKHVFGILQKLSYIRHSQLMMISFGIISMIFKIFRNQADTLEDTSIKYLMGLIMNLAVKKGSIINFQKHKSEIISILLKYIDVDDSQIKGYVNGTLYVLLQLESIKTQAVEKHKLKQIINTLLKKSEQKIQFLQEDADETCSIRQYKYILQRINNNDAPTIQQDENYQQDDDDDEQYIEDLEDAEINSQGQSNSSQYIEGEDSTLNGQELLMKKYALLGPEAVRQQIINRSILDETSRKSNNMTTSISHSKRMDKVFQKTERPDTPSLLPGNLDLSMAANR